LPPAPKTKGFDSRPGGEKYSPSRAGNLIISRKSAGLALKKPAKTLAQALLKVRRSGHLPKNDRPGGDFHENICYDVINCLSGRLLIVIKTAQFFIQSDGSLK
jgi:hypothetical protein